MPILFSGITYGVLKYNDRIEVDGRDAPPRSLG
ncbi:ATP-dependent DNA helicase pif1, partial [Fusarium oxysporum f. sp. albedinis]